MSEDQSGRLIKAIIDVRRCLQLLAGQGELTEGEYLVLRRVKIEHEGNIDRLNSFRAMRISEYLLMPPPAVSRIFNSLESKGLILRQINHKNRRSVVILLTPEGEKALFTAELRIKKFIDAVSSQLGDEDTRKLLSLLDAIVGVFNSGVFA